MTKQFMHFEVAGMGVVDTTYAIDGGAFTETEVNARQAEIASRAGVALGAVSVRLGNEPPPPPDFTFTPDPVLVGPPTLEQKVDGLIETLSKSKTLAAEDKAALEALKR